MADSIGGRMSSQLPVLLLLLVQPIFGQWAVQPGVPNLIDLPPLNFDLGSNMDQGLGQAQLPLSDVSNQGLLNLNQLSDPNMPKRAFRTLQTGTATATDSKATDCIKTSTGAASGFVLAEAKDVASAADCQKVCQKTDECQFFEWVGPDNKEDTPQTCTMFNESGKETEHVEHVSHGPKNC